MRYVAFVHQDDEPGVGISFPDFPGCVTQADTIDDAVTLGAEALAFHVEGMVQDGQSIPVPRPLSDILADADLAEWREGATIAYVPLIRDLGSPRRVNITIDPGLLEAIDEAASRRGMTRSAFLASAARKEVMG